MLQKHNWNMKGEHKMWYVNSCYEDYLQDKVQASQPYISNCLWFAAYFRWESDCREKTRTIYKHCAKKPLIHQVTDSLIITLAGTRAIIKVSGHQYRWLASGYDLETGHFQNCLAWWLPGGLWLFCTVKAEVVTEPGVCVQDWSMLHGHFTLKWWI